MRKQSMNLGSEKAQLERCKSPASVLMTLAEALQGEHWLKTYVQIQIQTPTSTQERRPRRGGHQKSWQPRLPPQAGQIMVVHLI